MSAPQAADIVAQPMPPLWADAGLLPAKCPGASRFAAAALLARAARRAADTQDPASARACLGAAQAVLAGREPPTAAGDPLLGAALAARAAFAARPDIIQMLDRTLQAAERDAKGTPCRSWGELLMMGQFASVPVGRALLAAASDESQQTVAWTDRLFQACFVIERISGAKHASIQRHRVDLPLRWPGGPACEPADFMSDGVTRRAIVNRMLDGIHDLLNKHEGTHHARTPAVRAALTQLHCRARRMSRRLRKTDPFIHAVACRRIDDSICRLTARIIAWLG